MASFDSVSRRGKRANSPPPAHGDSGMVSLVVLSGSYVLLNLDKLRERLDSVFPGWFLPPREQGTFVIDGAVPDATFLIQSSIPGAAGIFMLHNVPGPYTQFSSFADRINDASMRRRARQQKCWLSIDLISSKAKSDEAYRFIGQVIASLAPPDTAFVVHPGTLAMLTFDLTVRRRLASGEHIFGG